MLHLSRLFVHPVKSLAALPLSAVDVRERGLRHDRSWVVVAEDGVALTQRDLPAMATIGARVEGSELLLEAAGRASLRLDPARAAGLAGRRSAKVWDETVDAADMGPEAAAWLSEALGRACHLVHMDARAERFTRPDGGAPRTVRFADELPVLVLGEASLAELEARAPGRGEARRFRPNFVIAGSAAHAEDHWLRLRVGEVELELVKPAGRCVLVNVDPQSGVPDPGGQPLRTLARYRRVTEGAYPDKPGRVYLGVVGSVTRPGRVSVGDEVEVLETREA